MNEPKQITLIIVICAIGILVILGITIFTGDLRTTPPEEGMGHMEAVRGLIPTIIEIQERIGAKPDGILGKETQEKWDLYLCNQEAKIWLNKDTMKHAK
ncbi:hypothetical protein LCGC14_1697510 [marine sediment metagenome]|uniref:Uncharacterized protein n=1 Tax=marine sediment metagenome TaxID=412755 RepID=A0A0F9HIS1_9ZZZZ